MIQLYVCAWGLDNVRYQIKTGAFLYRIGGFNPSEDESLIVITYCFYRIWLDKSKERVR